MIIMTCYLCNEVIQSGEITLETRGENGTLYGCVHEYCFRDMEATNSSYEPPSDAITFWDRMAEADPEEPLWKKMVVEQQKRYHIRTFGKEEAV